MNTLLINRSKKGRILACIAAAAVTFAMTASPIFAAESGIRTIKDETVYVVTNSDGSTSDIIVSDHLKNNSSVDTISDVSPLSDIENTKGDEKFSKGDNNILTWSAKGNDIYYQGKTDKQTPISMSIKYYLDDKEVEGKALEGKSGKVRIVINYENNSGLLINGIAALDIGSKKLNDGMQKFYSEGIEKIVNLYNSKLKGTVNNADAVINAGKSYSTFTELADGMNGSVKFIYRTKLAEE